MDDINSGKILASKDIKKAMVYIDRKLSDPDVFIDSAKIDKAVELIERYFEMKLFDWELFVIGLVHCYYKSTDTVVFREFLIVMGRGNGKNGFISGLAWYLTTHYHGVKGYNVDIIANSEDQAKTSFDDIYEVLDRHWKKLKSFFYKSKLVIKNLKTGSYIKFNTSNAKTKDGKRSACLIFDEEHEYESEDNIKVFSSGFGKRKHSRKFKITSHGYVRDGVLDVDLRLAADILNGVITDLDICPLIYRVDKKEEVLDPKCWPKANPSYNYLTELRKEIDSAFKEMKYKASVEQDFYTKRMNWPIENKEIAVTSWENLERASREVPDLTGRECIAGIDYAMLSDMASVGLWFRDGDERYWIQHSWICRSSKDWNVIRAPLEDWHKKGDLTIVEETQIDPKLIVNWLKEKSEIYKIKKVSLDNARLALMREALYEIGFSTEEKNIWIVRPLGIVSVVPVLDYLFDMDKIAFGDTPLMRWATFNTKKKPTGDVGNYKYEKIEPKSRKTDPFMAMVAAAVRDEDLESSPVVDTPQLPCFTF
jgi:phage terminase large subunit-like protein